jgi:hypothetical protein
MLANPRGVEHRPVADEDEVQILLIEPTGTPNTRGGIARPLHLVS